MSPKPNKAQQNLPISWCMYIYIYINIYIERSSSLVAIVTGLAQGLQGKYDPFRKTVFPGINNRDSYHNNKTVLSLSYLCITTLVGYFHIETDPSCMYIYLELELLYMVVSVGHG